MTKGSEDQFKKERNFESVLAVRPAPLLLSPLSKKGAASPIANNNKRRASFVSKAELRLANRYSQHEDVLSRNDFEEDDEHYVQMFDEQLVKDPSQLTFEETFENLLLLNRKVVRKLNDIGLDA